MGGIIGGIIFAWILSWFRLDHTVAAGLHELFGLNIGIAGYYVLFGIAGFLTELFAKHRYEKGKG